MTWTGLLWKPVRSSLIIQACAACRVLHLFVLVEYVLALLLVGLTTGVLHLFGSVLDTQIATVGYLVPVVDQHAGLGTGTGYRVGDRRLLRVQLFLHRTALHAVRSQRPQDLLVLAVFLAIAVLLSQLLGRTRAALNAAQQREHEALRLYEFSTALAGQQTDQSIARTMAQYALESFQADRVEVVVEASGDQARPASACRPIDRLRPIGRRLSIAPLLTARGLQGEIRLWLDRAALDARRRSPAQDLCHARRAGPGTIASGAIGNTRARG